MGCTVSELGERLSAEEFTEACVYLREEPLDPALLAALAELLAALANGALSKPDKSFWTSGEFLGSRWQTSAQPSEAADPATSSPTAAQLRSMFGALRR